MLYEIDARLFNAVTACAAVQDVRYYLNAFFVDATNHKLVGTNGHVMAVAPLELLDGGGDAPTHHGLSAEFKGWLYSAMRKPLGKSVETVRINTNARELILSGDKYRGPDTIELEPIDGVFPDYRRVKADNGEGNPIPAICFNPEYLARIVRWAHLDTPQCVLTFEDQKSAIEVWFHDVSDLHVTLMPCRI